VIPTTAPPIDSRSVDTLLAEFQNRQQGYLPQWNPPAQSAGAAIGPIFARMISAILQRLNQAPNKDQLAMLDLLGLRLVPAQPARAPIVFSLTQGSSDTSAPEGTQVAAPPPPGSSQQIVFSIEEDAAVAAATLSEVFSLWPGRDEYINHSAALAAAQPFTLFQNLQLQQTDHILYLAHSQYLAFAGTTTLKVVFDLAQEGSSPLDITWEYWDGQVWRGFIVNQPTCLDPVQYGTDGTNGLSTSGSVQLNVQGAQSAQTAVNGVTSYWIRARVTQPLLPDPNQILPETETVRLVTVVQQNFEDALTCGFAAPSASKIFVQDSFGDILSNVPVVISVSSATSSMFTGTTDSTGLVVVPQPFTVNTNYTIVFGSQQYTATYEAPAQYVNLLLNTPASGSAATATMATIMSLTNGAGSPLAGAAFTITDSSGSGGGSISDTTDANGNYLLLAGQSFNPGGTYAFTVIWSGQRVTATAVYPGAPVFEMDLAFSLQALRVDKAYADGRTLDVTKAFQPFGPLPQVGSVFYFKQTETFSKPGAAVQIFVNAIALDLPPAGANPFTHIIAWEYWNGYDWSALISPTAGADFTTPQIIRFTVPNDMRSTTVNSETGLWVRVRVAGGKYGYLQTLQLPQNSTPSMVTFPVTQAPVLADFRVSYSWQNGPFPLEQVFAYNDFQFADYTSNAQFPSSSFAPYQLLGDVTPAVYLGFTKQLPVNNFGVYFYIAEQPSVTSGPDMIWEYWSGGEWATAVVDEEDTQDLVLAGMIVFIPAADAQPLARFDTPLYWLRGRLKEDGPPDETTINNIYTNAVWASQWQTYSDSPLGTSTGVPSQLFTFNQIPILSGQEIEVQELSGSRANTEWRSIAIQVFPDNPDIVTELEAQLAAEGPQTDIIIGDVHLVRDKTKSVTAVWIQWHEVRSFFESGPNDRVYVLDHALGRLFFGDGNEGMIPPLGALIQATSFLSGGGLAGNVGAATITQLLGAVSGVQSVTNPRAAEGGADGETLQQFQQRAPSNFRNRGRAIVPADYEALAKQASAGVAVARAFPALDSSGIARPGYITIMIIPQSTDPQPIPSAGLRQDVLNYLLACSPADIAAAQAINVIGPTYLPVDVSATLAPVDPDEAGTIEQAALNALAAFLNPLIGGPGGLGWDVGRGLYASDVATVLGDVEGVDYVQELALYVNGVLQSDQVQVPLGQIVVAGQFKVSLVLPVGG
jgi:hypothetical protein